MLLQEIFSARSYSVRPQRSHFLRRRLHDKRQYVAVFAISLKCFFRSRPPENGACRGQGLTVGGVALENILNQITQVPR
jgi:hypothetical protein